MGEKQKRDWPIDDRMKWYEARYAQERFLPMLPIFARLDGRCFHTFTRGMNRPYDERFSGLMQAMTEFLVKETHARCGYTQSDEITLVFLQDDWGGQVFFDGRVQKMTSVLASLAGAYFSVNLPDFLPHKAGSLPVFDCRCWQVPNEAEAANVFAWREQDAVRNSLQMAAQTVRSSNQLHGKNASDLHEILHESGINWNDYPSFFKRGTYVRRREVDRPFTPEELDALPPKHDARTNPDLVIRRTVVMREEFPPLTKLRNRAAVLLHGADPITEAETIQG